MKVDYSDKLNEFKRKKERPKEKVDQKNKELEALVKYITDSDITSVKTDDNKIGFFKKIPKDGYGSKKGQNPYEIIDIFKKMYKDGYEKGQNPYDIIEEINDFYLHIRKSLRLRYDDMGNIHTLMSKLQEYPNNTETYLDDDEIDEEKVRRPSIPQNIKDKVWNRDGGKCVECGSNEKIEFDHIIPFSKGGTDTYRNLQILCEKCNRSKSDKIG